MTYVTEGRSTLEHIISKSEAEKNEKSEKVKKGSVGDVLGKTLKHVRAYDICPLLEGC